MNKTGIEYLNYTLNLTHGCTNISQGCLHCWAKTTSKRPAGMGVNGYSKGDSLKVVCCPEKLQEPFKIKKPSRIGVSFMGDLFHKEVPDDFRDKVFAMMALNPLHSFLLLTKRPQKAFKYLTSDRDFDSAANLLYDRYIRSLSEPLFSMGEITLPLGNVWIGTTVENQPAADNRLSVLAQIHVAVKFISFEPMLSEIKVGSFMLSQFQWAIIGAESGPGKRPCKIEWVRDLVRQCKDAGVPVFVKQLNIDGKIVKNINQFPDDLKIREYPGGLK